VRVGAHLRRKGTDLAGVIQTARAVGADTLQVFLSSPRTWAGPRVVPAEAERFRFLWRESGLAPLVAHAPYLVNVASPNPAFLERSRGLMVETLHACEAFGVEVLVVHAGAGGAGEPAEALSRAAGSLREAVRRAGSIRVVVELIAGTSGAVASTIPDAARLLDAVRRP